MSKTPPPLPLQKTTSNISSNIANQAGDTRRVPPPPKNPGSEGASLVGLVLPPPMPRRAVPPPLPHVGQGSGAVPAPKQLADDAAIIKTKIGLPSAETPQMDSTQDRASPDYGVFPSPPAEKNIPADGSSLPVVGPSTSLAPPHVAVDPASVAAPKEEVSRPTAPPLVTKIIQSAPMAEAPNGSMPLLPPSAQKSPPPPRSTSSATPPALPPREPVRAATQDTAGNSPKDETLPIGTPPPLATKITAPAMSSPDAVTPPVPAAKPVQLSPKNTTATPPRPLPTNRQGVAPENGETIPKVDVKSGEKKSPKPTIAIAATVLVAIAAAYGFYEYREGSTKGEIGIGAISNANKGDTANTNPTANVNIADNANAQFKQALSLAQDYFHKTGVLPVLPAQNVVSATTQGPIEQVRTFFQKVFAKDKSENPSAAIGQNIESGAGKQISSLLEQSAAAGNAQARYLLAVLLTAPNGAKPSKDLTDRQGLLLKQAADAGLFIAQLSLAQGSGSALALDKPHFDSALVSANSGFAPAQVQVARYYLEKNDAAQAVAWLEKAVAVANTDSTDPLTAFRQRIFSSQKDSYDRQYISIGEYDYALELIDGKVVHQDLSRAHSLIQSAARHGIAAALLADAKMRISGQGTDKRPDEGRTILEQLSNAETKDNGCKNIFAECGGSYANTAKYLLALNHFIQTPGFAEVTQAIPLLQASADSGNLDAKSLLGWAFLEGKETDSDPQKAFVLLTAASDGGVVDAKYRLAQCYLDGKGTAVNLQKARELLRDAASQGHQDAQKLLSTI